MTSKKVAQNNAPKASLINFENMLAEERDDLESEVTPTNAQKKQIGDLFEAMNNSLNTSKIEQEGHIGPSP